MKIFHPVLLLLFLLPASINADKSLKFGHWSTTSYLTNGKLVSLATTQNENNTLGFFCVSGVKDCLPYLSNGTTCTPNQHYSMLVMVEGKGASAVNVLCESIGDRYIYNLPKSYSNLILESNKLAVAYALGGFQFKASYFELDGSAKALFAAKKSIKAFESNQKPKKKAKPPKKIFL